jgi:hypothetical protein
VPIQTAAGAGTGPTAPVLERTGRQLPPPVPVARALTVARDLSAGNLVAAYQLPAPPSAVGQLVAVPSSAVPGGLQIVSARRARATARRAAPAGAERLGHVPQLPGPPTPGPGGAGSHDLAPPAGGGAAMPLILVTILMLIAVPCIKLVTVVPTHPLAAVGHRLERPG